MDMGFEWGLCHIILLILQLKRSNVASNTSPKTPIFGTLIYKFQQVRVARPPIAVKIVLSRPQPERLLQNARHNAWPITK